ncbi:MAG: ECF transporter S component [Oscillospiraceae bacterium]|nr:ECF transporter S component [Oscillospiraceae bacterium]
MKDKRIYTIAAIGILAAIMLILGFTPIGLISIPGLSFKITVLHIPVIIGGCMLGWKSGAVLGGLFGLISFYNNSFIAPTITSFVFTPFYSVSPEYSGNLWSLLICFIPRIMIGIVSALVYNGIFALVKRRSESNIASDAGRILAGGIAGFAGAATNTILVFTGIGLFFGGEFTIAKGEASFMDIVYATITANAIVEAIAAVIFAAAVVKPLSIILENQKT